MILGHRIKQKIEISKFLEQIQEYEKNDVESTDHTFFHFSKKQKKIFSEEWIKEILFNEEPILVGIQYNRYWTVFYKYNKEIFRVIIDINPNKIYIVTFYKIDETQIPKI